MQVPSTQSLLQQSASCAQSCPIIAQVAEALQRPSTQKSEQQSADRAHGSPSEAQPLAWQVAGSPPMLSHRPEQHSPDDEQSSPTALQRPVGPRQIPESQRPEQQSSSSEQSSPTAAQSPDAPGLPASATTATAESEPQLAGAAAVKAAMATTQAQLAPLVIIEARTPSWGSVGRTGARLSE